MVFLGLFLRADMDNVSRILPADVDHWEISVRCGSCNEDNPTPITVSADDSMAISGSRGEANVVMKCKFCKREGSIRIVDNSVVEWAEDQPLVRFECRGIDITKWHPKGGWTVYAGNDSPTKWTDVDLSDDWMEYDEKSGDPVSISDVATDVRRVKG
ncbi:hypothetical protein BCR44DRAFT_49202 [Catenaria anguillulae PL171]|uniref:DUF866-domain-containing protein n=1 Tax=Catenaria anguillulae PL171 TaxID=765915 RepID=A0A1Y2HH13_9FUNG|nr:hypothetical protein BCR44DRAFT_49202 [Catenaria anguillulae PL171]